MKWFNTRSITKYTIFFKRAFVNFVLTIFADFKKIENVENGFSQMNDRDRIANSLVKIIIVKLVNKSFHFPQKTFPSHKHY